MSHISVWVAACSVNFPLFLVLYIDPRKTKLKFLYFLLNYTYLTLENLASDKRILPYKHWFFIVSNRHGLNASIKVLTHCRKIGKYKKFHGYDVQAEKGHRKDSLRPQIYIFNPYPTAFPYGNGMVLHFYQQQESSTTKTVHKVINKGLKAYV